MASILPICTHLNVTTSRTLKHEGKQ